MKKYLHKYFEMIVWMAALIAIAFVNPAQHGFSFCVFKMAGFTWCPGCGLTHAMSYAMHGNFAASFKEHVFGIPALLIISHRIVVLGTTNFKTHKSLYHGF